MIMAAEEPQGPPVELSVFSGPLDLLLHLIKQNEVSIYDIPIFSICDQYNTHLKALYSFEPDELFAMGQQFSLDPDDKPKPNLRLLKGGQTLQ